MRSQAWAAGGAATSLECPVKLSTAKMPGYMPSRIYVERLKPTGWPRGMDSWTVVRPRCFIVTHDGRIPASWHYLAYMKHAPSGTLLSYHRGLSSGVTPCCIASSALADEGDDDGSRTLVDVDR